MAAYVSGRTVANPDPVLTNGRCNVTAYEFFCSTIAAPKLYVVPEATQVTSTPCKASLGDCRQPRLLMRRRNAWTSPQNGIVAYSKNVVDALAKWSADTASTSEFWIVPTNWNETCA